MKYIPLWKFEILVDLIINSREKFYFTIAEFRNALKEVPKRNTAARAINEPPKCPRCDDTGCLTYKKKLRNAIFSDYNYSFAARCSCEAGDNHVSKVTTEDGKIYVIPRYDDLFPKEVEVIERYESNEPVETEDIRALNVLTNHPELLKPIQGKSYEEWREYITRPEIVQVLMASEKAIIE